MCHLAVGLAWLVYTFAPRSTGLEKRGVVLGGSFTRPVDIATGDVIHANYGELGAIGISFV
jgi:2-oxo-hept-3-ene-1,7-dioate hydratase